NKGYPLRAKKNGIEGKVEVGFTVLSAGNVADIRIISPSGYDVLDGEAVSLIKKCSPFLKIPEPLGRSKIGFGTIIVFKLREK
ncbi:MAG: TonB family protein, partial [Candidatus Omnitrophota bacterium]